MISREVGIDASIQTENADRQQFRRNELGFRGGRLDPVERDAGGLVSIACLDVDDYLEVLMLVDADLPSFEQGVSCEAMLRGSSGSVANLTVAFQRSRASPGESVMRGEPPASFPKRYVPAVDRCWCRRRGDAGHELLAILV